jgi:hypothetical protein
MMKRGGCARSECASAVTISSLAANWRCDDIGGFVRFAVHQGVACLHGFLIQNRQWTSKRLDQARANQSVCSSATKS